MSEQRKSKYKIGDMVRLNVGGPDMAVKSISRRKIYETGEYVFDGEYNCQWFAGKKLDNGSFPEDSLNPVQENKAGEA